MGLFSRKESGSSRRQSSRPRPSVSSEAQAATLRVKARRRLTGAVALVLAVVVILPVLLDGGPKPIPSGVEITIPSKNSPYQPLSAPTAEAMMGDEAIEDSAQSDSAMETTVATPIATDGDAGTPLSPSTEQTQAQTQTPAPKASESAAMEEKVSQKQGQPGTETPTPVPAPAAPASEPARTDDGSRALALLAGQAPTETPSTEAQLIVQIASYSSEADARSRQDKLKGEGVSNAFVEESVIDGKTMYRLRVGPFGSREAAQAAQTRLRTLGYSNGFIATR